MSIKYITGDATAPKAIGDIVIAHIVNNVGAWGAGFVLALSKRWPEPEASFRRHRLSLGTVQVVKVEPRIHVANMCAQDGIGLSKDKPPLRYDDLYTCLSKLSRWVSENHISVHMPRIGCGLAGGDWRIVEVLIEKTLIKNGIDVYIYDLR